MRTKFNGDCNTIDSHQMHEVKITKPQAELIVIDICKNYNLNPPVVFFTGRKTKHTLGTYNRVKELIKLQTIGENYGTLIHELAHHIVVKQFGTKVPTHGFQFKNTQRMILQHIKTHVVEYSVFGVFNNHVASEIKNEKKPIVTLTAPTVIQTPKKVSTTSSGTMNSRNVAILDVLRVAPNGLTIVEIGKYVNELLHINRNSWDTPMYELRKAGLVDYNPKTKTYRIPGGN